MLLLIVGFLSYLVLLKGPVLDRKTFAPVQNHIWIGVAIFACAGLPFAHPSTYFLQDFFGKLSQKFFLWPKPVMLPVKHKLLPEAL